MQEGFLDDIHTHEKVKIRLFNTHPDLFYYFHTPINDMEDTEEPNPILYIGYLKK